MSAVRVGVKDRLSERGRGLLWHVVPACTARTSSSAGKCLVSRTGRRNGDEEVALGIEDHRGHRNGGLSAEPVFKGLISGVTRASS
jgi:hypothetical protein